MTLKKLWPGNWLIQKTEFDRPLVSYDPALSALTNADIDHLNRGKLDFGSFRFAKWSSWMISASISDQPDPQLRLRWTVWGRFHIHLGVTSALFLWSGWGSDMLASRYTLFHHSLEAAGRSVGPISFICLVFLVNSLIPYGFARLYVRHHLEHMGRSIRLSQDAAKKDAE